MKILICAMVIFYFSGVSYADATEYTWRSDVSGLWTNPENWDPIGIPGDGDTAIINSGTVETINDNTVAKLFFNGGIITGDGTLTVIDSFYWERGEMRGNGVTVLDKEAHTDISKMYSKEIIGRPLENKGTIALAADSHIQLQDGAKIINSGEFELHDNAEIRGGTGEDREFHNQTGGIIKKLTGNGVAVINGRVGLFNSGEIIVQSGSLFLPVRGESNGSFHVFKDAIIRFDGSGEGNLLTESSVQGSGLIEKEGSGNLSFEGTYNIGQGTRVFSGTVDFHGDVESVGNELRIIRHGRVYFHSNDVTVPIFEMNGHSGMRLGGLATVTITDSLLWVDSGTMTTEGGRTVLAESGFAHFTGRYILTVHRRQLDLYGNTFWDSGTLRIAVGGIINNFGLFEVHGERLLTRGSGSNFVFQNHENAVFRKPLDGTATIRGIHFHNDGLLEVLKGTLEMDGGGEITGIIQTHEGTHLRFFRYNTRTYNFYEGSTFTINGKLTIEGNTLVFHDEVKLPQMTRLYQHGRLQTENRIIIPDTLIWYGGFIQGTGTIHITESGLLIIGGDDQHRGRDITLENMGTIRWTGTGPFNVDYGLVVENHGLFEIDVDAQMRRRSGAWATFNNQEDGVFRKIGGELNTRISNTWFNNWGLIDVQSGAIQFVGSPTGEEGVFVQHRGITRLHDGGLIAQRSSLNETNTLLTIEGGKVEGSGSIDADLLNLGKIRINFDNNNGILRVNGDYIQGTDGQLELSIGGRTPGKTYDQLSAWNVDLSGILQLKFDEDFLPMDDDAFSIVSWTGGTRSGMFDEIKGLKLPDGRELQDRYTPINLSISGGMAVINQPYISVSGRENYRPGRKQTYRVHYGNSSSDSLIVPITLMFPPEVDVEIRFDIEDGPLFEPEDEDDKITETAQTEFQVDGKKVVPVLMGLPPGARGSMSVRASRDDCDDGREKFVDAGIGHPWEDQKLGNCLQAVFDTAFGFLPGGACFGLGTSSARNAIYASQGKEIGVWGTVFSTTLSVARCAGSVIPTSTFWMNAGGVVSQLVGLESGLSSIESACEGAFTARIDRALEALDGESFSARCVQSWDPNEKTGLIGVGGMNYTRARNPVPYTIFFENVDTAEAAAQDVFVTDELDPEKWDLSTFQLGTMSFGDWVVEVPQGLTKFQTEVDLRPDMDLLVGINVELDIMTGVLSWTFRSLDPETGEPTEDPLAGFLPPNVNPPEGDGSVSFTVLPNQDLESGSMLINEASIVFDTNEPILTGPWINTIDRTPPTSSVSVLDSVQTDMSFEVSWSGVDNYSGIESYSIFVSKDNGPFELWLSDTAATAAMYDGEANIRYAFFSIAKDSVGNAERIKFVPEAETILIPTSVEDEVAGIPREYELNQNYPNPFNPATTIRFALPEASKVKLMVYDILGREVEILVDGYKDAGYYEAVFDAGHLSSGVYLYQLRAGDFVETKRFMLVK